MKKLKKSAIWIISIVSVAVVALATILTVIIANNGGNPGSGNYRLTTEQSLLVSEINKTLNSSVSNNKEQSVIAEKADFDVNSGVHYFDESVAWSQIVGGYGVYIYPDASDKEMQIMLIDHITFGNNPLISNYESASVISAFKNHFVIYVTYADNNAEFIVCSVKNHNVVTHKRYAVSIDGSNAYLNGKLFSIMATENFFAVLTNSNNKYYYSFYEYLTDYTYASNFKYAVDEDYISRYSVIGNDFLYTFNDMKVVVNYDENLGFVEYPLDDTLKLFVLPKGKIMQKTTIHNTKVLGAELVNGKYHSYSYTLQAGGKTLNLNLGGYNKVSAKMYASANYFGLFLQKVDDKGKFIDGGIAVYYDYNLNVIARYSASSQASRIYCADNSRILTDDGIYSTKNQVDLSRLYSFESMGMKFQGALARGKYILKSESDSLYVYNLNMVQTCERNFDELVNKLDDDNVIFKAQGEFYRYNLSSNVVDEIAYVDSQFSKNSTMYLIQKEEGVWSLYDGIVKKDYEIINYHFESDKLLYFETINKEYMCYLVDENGGYTSSGGFSSSADSSEDVYSAGVSDTTWYNNGASADGAEIYVESEWYDYTDKVLTNVQNTSTATEYTIMATHCIQKGYYSKIDYRDYFEIHYAGENSGHKTKYQPWRVYYKVNVVDGQPKLEIQTIGHHWLERSLNAYDSSLSYIKDNLRVSPKSGYSNMTHSDSYDYTIPGTTNRYYYYTSYPIAGTGIEPVTIASDDLVCKAEVYGESIKVTLVFNFKCNGTAYLKLKTSADGTHFGQTNYTDSDVVDDDSGKDIVNYVSDWGISEVDYYNKLYYQTIVVGLKTPSGLPLNSSFNYNEKLIKDTSTYPINDYFIDEQFPTLFQGDNANKEIVQTLVNSSLVLSTDYNATVSNKVVYNGAYSKLHIGLIALDISGGRLVGVTNLETLEGLSHSSLYSTLSKTYQNERLHYKATGNGVENPSSFDIIDYEYLKYDDRNKSYYFNIKNADAIYCNSGLNKNRYVYCLYEPLTYYFELDYNVAEEDDEHAGLAQELAYLQKYAGLSIGVDGQPDYTQFTKNWVYKNVTEDNIGDSSEVNGTGPGQKYEPNDFTLNTSRQDDRVEKKASIFVEDHYTFEDVYANKHYIYGVSLMVDGSMQQFYFNKVYGDISKGYKNETECIRTDDKIYVYALKNRDSLSYNVGSGYNSYYYSSPNSLSYLDYDDHTLNPGFIDSDESVLICIDFSKSVTGEAYYFERNIVTGASAESWSAIKSYENDNSRYYYITINGDRYYIQKNAGVYTKSYLELRDSAPNKYYFKAYKDKDELDDLYTANHSYGYLKPMTSSDYASAVYSPGCAEFCILINLDSTVAMSNRAYYFTQNMHTRDAVYETGTFTVTEKFSFKYTDSVIFTSNPQHLHYIFDGWKFVQGDLLGYNSGIMLPFWPTNIPNFDANPVSGTSYYLASTGENYKNIWGDYFTTVNPDGSISWKSTNQGIDNPVRLIAQWTPVTCSVDVVLWTKQGDEDYKGCGPETEASGVVSGIIDTFVVSPADAVPKFTISNQDISEIETNAGNQTGKLKATITFLYSRHDNFLSIYEAINNAGYSASLINSTGMECKIVGWVYKHVEESTATSEYRNLIWTDPVTGESEKFGEYIGDTTVLRIYALYAPSSYDVHLNLYPHGGALNDETKPGHGANDLIYNDEVCESRFNVMVKAEGISSFQQYYVNALGSLQDYDDLEGMHNADAIVNRLVLNNDQNYYQLALMGNFTVGSNLTFRIQDAHEAYYVKKLLFRNVTLFNDSGQYEKYTILFTYNHYSTSNAGWSVNIASETNAGGTLSMRPTLTEGGIVTFIFGNYTTDSENKDNAHCNVISITNADKFIDVVVNNISNPGSLDADNKLTGEQGFSLDVILEAYSSKNETIKIEYEDSSERETDFVYNNAILTAGQALSDREGKSLSNGEKAYVWLGASQYYLWTWSDSVVIDSGYYRIYTGGERQADLMLDFEYSQFINQGIFRDADIVVYYDSDAEMIYYPNQLALSGTVNETSTQLNIDYISDSKAKYYIIIDNVEFCLFKGNKSSFEAACMSGGTYVSTYIRAEVSDTEKISPSINVGGSVYTEADNYYTPGKTSLYVHLQPNGSVKYFKENVTNLYPGFNNTRIVAIDPEQKNVYISNTPSHLYQEFGQFELTYYIKSLKLDGNIITFNKPTREIINDGTYYKYSNLIMHENGTIIEDVDYGIGFDIKYLGVKYAIQDGIKITLPENSDRIGADVYYFYLTRDPNGFTRYFLIYDIPEEDQRSRSSSLDALVDIEITFEKLLHELEIKVVEEDLYKDKTVTARDDYGNELYTYTIVDKSFEVSYTVNDQEHSSNIAYLHKFSFEDDVNNGSRYNYQQIKNYPNNDAGNRLLQDYRFYQYGTKELASLPAGYNYPALEVIDDVPPTDTSDLNAWRNSINAWNKNLIGGLSNLGDVPTVSWGSITRFSPSDTNMLKIRATSGYIIKSFAITFGTRSSVESSEGNENFKTIISFELDESSFDDLVYISTTEQYSYTKGVEALPTLKYKIVTNVEDAYHASNSSIGFDILANKVFTGNSGLLFNNMANREWASSDKYDGVSDGTYTLDQIFVLLSGLYGDVQIDVHTTSFSEYLIESGSVDNAVNPLLRNDITETDSGKDYKTLTEGTIDDLNGSGTYSLTGSALQYNTYLNLYTQKYNATDHKWEFDVKSEYNDNDALGTVDPDFGFSTGIMHDRTPISEQNYIGDKYKALYYVNGTSNGIKKGSLRILFCGTVSRIRSGLHFIASHDDYSVYFTNGRYYYQPASSSASRQDSFYNLEDYAGRTVTDKAIAKDLSYHNVSGNFVYQQNSSKHTFYAEINGERFYLFNSIDDDNYDLFKTALVDRGGSLYCQLVKDLTVGSSPTIAVNSSEFDSSTYYDGCAKFYVKCEVVDVAENKLKYKYNVEDDLAGGLNYTNKLVYMSTGPLYKDGDTGYFASNKANFVSNATLQIESNYKYFISMKAVVNTIIVETDSYLFDKNLILGGYPSGSTPDSNTFANNTTSQNYNFYEAGKLALNGNELFQLDDTNKRDSWFNDTVLTNMQLFSYKDVYSAGEITNPQMWQHNSTANPDKSEIAVQEMRGYDFKWTYYSIAGYKLDYILIYLPDVRRYYYVAVDEVVEELSSEIGSGSTKKSGFISINSSHASAPGQSNYNYNFRLEFSNDLGDTKGTSYTLYPVIYQGEKPNGGMNDESGVFLDDYQYAKVDKLNSINLMANNIKVAFISKPYSYTIEYKNYDLAGADISSFSTSVFNGINTQEIKYDSMIRLAPSITMTGYTFIGWASEQYYKDGNYYDRFFRSGTNAAVWNASSQWYEPTKYFGQNADEDGMSQSASYYSFLQDVSSVNPCRAFYVNNGYFVTDTGYKSGVNSQNYNFFGNYSMAFSKNLTEEWQERDGKETDHISLYAIFKANVYTIQFDVNNVHGDAYYLSFNEQTGESEYKDSDWFSTKFLEGNLGLYTPIEDSDKRRMYYAYVTFDSNDWYYSENLNQELVYAYKVANSGSYPYNGVAPDTDGADPYISYNMTRNISDGSQNYELTRLSVDMFGYSWLGWYYKTLNNGSSYYNEGSLPDATDGLIMQSSYNKSAGSYALPTLKYDFYNTLKDASALFEPNNPQSFVYKGQHKANEKLSVVYKESGELEHLQFNIDSDIVKLFYRDYADHTYYFRIDTSKTTKNKFYELYSTYNAETRALTGKVSNMYIEVAEESFSGGEYKPVLLNYYRTTVNAVDGYVYFYDYAENRFNVKFDWTGSVLNDFISVEDSLNNLHWESNAKKFAYDNLSTTNLVFSYYDTSLSQEAYTVAGSSGAYHVKVNRTNYAYVRYIKLFANWVNNEYQVIFNPMDVDGFDQIGSSQMSNKGTYSSGTTTYFNDTSLKSYLWPDAYKEYANLPHRVGYDFIGWSFSYINPNGVYKEYAEIINQPSPYLYLCKELFAGYAVLNNVIMKDDSGAIVRDAEGKIIYVTSPYESNILMLAGNRINGSIANTWILNQEGKGERLGDGLGENVISYSETERYVYVFPVWRAQTFSINISLNIQKEQLQNLYEKDSSFALGLYHSSAHGEHATGNTKEYTGVTTSYYTLNQNAIWAGSDNYTFYKDYFKDIVANIGFEIEFDQQFDSAKLTFAGRTYTLKDLFMTSAGYYFLGLLYDNTAISKYSESFNDTTDGNANAYLLRNTLQSVLKRDTNGTVVHHDNAGDDRIKYRGGNPGDSPKTYYEEGDDRISVLNYAWYMKLYNSKFDTTNSSAANTHLLSDSSRDSENAGGLSTNFGYITSSGKKIPIKSEQIGSQYYLFVHLSKGNSPTVYKYYVVFYYTVPNPDAPDALQGNITFDRTFLYFNERDKNGNLLNRYIIYSYGTKTYFVNDRGEVVEIDINVAVYKTMTNSYNAADKLGALLDSDPSDVYGATISTTREITLYAHWLERDITSKIYNGNNGSESESSYDYSNHGLAGYYTIDTETKSAVSSGNTETKLSIEQTYNFHENVAFTFLPYFNGRYLSEITIEFDSLSETKAGSVSEFLMIKNSLTIRFTFQNEDKASDHVLVASEMYWNGVDVTTSMLSAFEDSKYKTSVSNASTSNVSAIPLLSLIDKYGMTYNNTGIYQHRYGEYGDRQDINQVTLNLYDMMTSVNFTCKFSVQTFQVEVYNVIVNESNNPNPLSGSDSIYTTNFASLDEMLDYSNYRAANVASYGAPYVSNLAFANTDGATTSINSALQVKSYNVPYYYNMGANAAVGGGYFGLDHIYNSSAKNGVTALQLPKSGLLGKLEDKVKTKYQKFDEIPLWYEFDKLYNNQVRVKALELDTGENSGYVKSNRVVYGFFRAGEALSTTVKFYYWNNDDEGKYVQYKNNEYDYTSGNDSNVKSSGGKYKITQLPSPSIASWYGGASGATNKKFLGYVCIDENVLKDLIRTGAINYDYDSAKMDSKTAYLKTECDILSALYFAGKINATDIDKISEISISGDTSSALSVFANRIEVVENKKYYCQSTTNFDYLDAVRVNLTLDITYVMDGITYSEEDFVVQKDLKMLNVAYELASGKDTYAIPLYEDIAFKFTGYEYDEITDDTKILILSSMTNHVTSNVFEVNSNYTIFYNPRDARIAVSSSENVTLLNLNSYTAGGDALQVNSPAVSKYYLFNEQTRSVGDSVSGAGSSQTFGLKKFTLASGYRYIYLYYVDQAGKAFAMTENCIYLEPGSVSAPGVEMINVEPMSPLEIDLVDNYKTTYDNVVKTSLRKVADNNAFGYESVEYYNRRLVIYILMQLWQCVDAGHLRIYNVNTEFRYRTLLSGDASNNNGTSTQTAEVDIRRVIEALNQRNAGSIDGFSRRVTNSVGMYRLAYSIAYYHVKTTGVNGGDVTGLEELYNDSVETNLAAKINDKFFTYDSSFGAHGLRPGDFLKDDRTLNGPTLVKDVLNTTKSYSYRTVYNNYDARIAIYLYTETNGSKEYVHLLSPTLDEVAVYVDKDKNEVNPGDYGIGYEICSTIIKDGSSIGGNLNRVYQEMDKYRSVTFIDKQNRDAYLDANLINKEYKKQGFVTGWYNVNNYSSGILTRIATSTTLAYKSEYYQAGTYLLGQYLIYLRFDVNNKYNDIQINYVNMTFLDTGDFYKVDDYERAEYLAYLKFEEQALIDARIEAEANAEKIADKADLETIAKGLIKDEHPDYTDVQIDAEYGTDEEGYKEKAWQKTYKEALAIQDIDAIKERKMKYDEDYINNIFIPLIKNELNNFTSHDYSESTLSGGNKCREFDTIKYYKYNLDDCKVYYDIKNSGTSNLDSRYYIDNGSSANDVGYDNGALWLMVMSGKDEVAAANVQALHVYTRYKSFF